MGCLSGKDLGAWYDHSSVSPFNSLNIGEVAAGCLRECCAFSLDISPFCRRFRQNSQVIRSRANKPRGMPKPIPTFALVDRSCFAVGSMGFVGELIDNGADNVGAVELIVDAVNEANNEVVVADEVGKVVEVEMLE